MSNSKTSVSQASRDNISESRTVKTVSLTDSGRGKSSMISKTRKDRERIKTKTLYVSTFNVRTLSTDDKLIEFEEELKGVNWHIIGLSEVRRCGESCTTLQNGHTLYHRGNQTNKINGVGFLVNKNIVNNIIEYKSISERVISIDLRVNKRYTCKIIQVYAPTTEHEDEEVEEFYEEINQVLNNNTAHYVLMMGDFNAKIGIRSDPQEKGVGAFGSGTRNERGKLLLNYVKENNLHIMNTYFKKKESRRWTWKSPNGLIKNEIDFLISNNKNIVLDTSVVNSVKMGSDHRMVRSKIYFDTKIERYKLISKGPKGINTEELRVKQEQYQRQLENCIDRNMLHTQSINMLNNEISKQIQEIAHNVAGNKKKKKLQLCQQTLDLIKKRKTINQDITLNHIEVTELNKTIRKKIRLETRNYKNQQVRQTLEERKSLKVLQREFKNRTHITKLVNENNIECTRMEELKELTEAFYRSLYESKAKPPLETSSKERQKVMNVGSEEIPDITSEEIERTMSKMPKGRTAGGDGIVLEMLIYGGEIVLDILKILYNKCLLECDVPADWKNALVVLLFKKGDKTKLSNYRPISLLSVMYKVFIKIITERLTNKLDSYQPKEQAGFRRGFSTLDHLQVVRTVIEKTNEYNIPIWVAFIDYEKAFDSVEIWAVLKALSNSRVDYRCTTLIQNIYSNATLQVMLKDFTDKIDIGRGVRQGESISPKLFTLALEDMFKNIGWETKGIKINGEYLSHLRFADDIVLFADNQQDLQDMLLELDQNSKKIGLKMNIGKTKYMTNDNITQETRIEIDNKKIEHTESYVYLGQKIEVSKNNLKAELPRRISLAWTAFGRLREVFCSGLPNTLKAQIFDQYVLPTLTYGTETWAINKEIICKLQTTQRAMERRMIGVTLRDRINNNIIRERSKVTDVIERLCRLRWSWAGHIARSKDDRWTRRVMEWRPWSSKRSRGRPQTRWTDDIKRLVGDNWMWHAQDRKEWQCLGEAYVRRWMDS
ncbi:uncharacterized protein LOC132696860 [Cylas formicarius]|uniref:uncharacterized protein LOC132696860 n=1 Tax=Cylas formicarius TaxID=197179 RepID=UPI0029589B2E|nr:uncharacterized protein LOC132696860 [Cylas formicarius]